METDTFMRLARQAPFHDAGHGYDVLGLHPPVRGRVGCSATRRTIPCSGGAYGGGCCSSGSPTGSAKRT